MGKSGPLINALLGVILSAILLSANYVLAMQKESPESYQKKLQCKSTYLLYENKCLACHESIADPERPGKTRDEWYIVVDIMHKYGLDLTEEETEKLTDFLFDLRKGVKSEFAPSKQ